MMAEMDQPVTTFGLGKDLVTGRGDRFKVKRPVPSVPDTSRLGGAAQSLHNISSSSSHVTRPDFVRPPWMAAGRHRQAGHSGSEGNSSVTMDHSSLKKEVPEGAPSSSAWDRPASMGNALDRREDMAQQARKAPFMYGNPLQALRANVARSSALADQAQLGAHQSRIALGTEPSSSHGAGTSGSPLPFYSRMKGNYSRFENHGVPSPDLRQQRIPTQGAIVAAGPVPETGKRPCTAQLTIFYAGMVNVYEDVPSDKAQAIMLLAGTGSPWSSSNYTDLRKGSSGANPARPSTTAGGMNHQPMSRVGSPVPHLGPPSPEHPSGAGTKLPNRQVTTAVELPQARKASLARFLEKRKDRIRKGPYNLPNDDSEAKKKNSRENSPSHPDTSSGKVPPSRRPLSPPAAAAPGSEPTSQPRTPPRQSTNLENRSHGKESENSSVDITTARGEQSSPFRSCG